MKETEHISSVYRHYLFEAMGTCVAQLFPCCPTRIRGRKTQIKSCTNLAALTTYFDKFRERNKPLSKKEKDVVVTFTLV